MSYGASLTILTSDPYLSTIFNADYDSTGILYNISDQPHRVIFDGTQFIAVGRGSYGTSGAFYSVRYTSLDGITWTRTDTLNENIESIIWAEDVYILSDPTAGVKTSTDLVNWTPLYTYAQLNGRIMYDMAYSPVTGKFIAVGSQNQFIFGIRATPI